MKQELIRGRDTANQLLEVIAYKLVNIPHHGDLDQLPLAEDLVRKVLRSFTNSLFLLHTNDEFLPIKDLPQANCPKFEVEDTDYKACKSFKTQRGCYKRK